MINGFNNHQDKSVDFAILIKTFKHYCWTTVNDHIESPPIFFIHVLKISGRQPYIALSTIALMFILISSNYVRILLMQLQ